MSDAQFEKILAERPPLIQALAREIRNLVFECDPDVVEVVWERQKIAGYGIGPRKLTEHYCYIQPWSGHVNLGFNHGVDLPDPDGLLEGAGKAFRHVKIAGENALKAIEPSLGCLLAEARSERAAARAAAK